MIIPLTHAGLTGRQKICAVLALVLLTTGVMIFTPETSWERLSTTPHEFSRGTLTGRTLIWTAGWELFREHPYLGVGANAFRLTVSRVLEEPIRMGNPKSPAPPAHNTFLSVLVEQGAIGFLIFAALLGALVLSLANMPALSRKLWIVCLAVWAVGVSSLTWEMRKPTWFLFGLLLAQGVGATQKIPWFRARKRNLPDYSHQPRFTAPAIFSPRANRAPVFKESRTSDPLRLWKKLESYKLFQCWLPAARSALQFTLPRAWILIVTRRPFFRWVRGWDPISNGCSMKRE